jgi:hypothetical protein
LEASWLEIRGHRFVYVEEVGLLDERVAGPIRLKHAILFFASGALALAYTFTGQQQVAALAVAIAILAVVSALVPKKSMPVEARLAVAVAETLLSRAPPQPGSAEPAEARPQAGRPTARPSAVGRPAAPAPVALGWVAGLAAATASLALTVLLPSLQSPDLPSAILARLSLAVELDIPGYGVVVVPLGVLLAPIALQLLLSILAAPVLASRGGGAAVAAADFAGALTLTTLAVAASLRGLGLPEEARVVLLAAAATLALTAVASLAGTARAEREARGARARVAERLGV